MARDLLPGGDETQAIALPERLGGGFLFVNRGQATSLWRAASFTGPLEPLATIEARIDRVEPGFDRLYLIGRRETRALDLESGMGVGLGPLPPAAAYRELRFTEGWTALAEVPIAGVLATFDGGQQWWPVPGARSIAGSGPRLLLTTDEGLAELGPEGTLSPLREGRSAPQDEGELPVSQERHRRALQQAVLRGAYLGERSSGEERVLVVVDGDLLIVNLRDGSVSQGRASVVTPGTECQGVTLDAEAGFVCQSPRGRTAVVAASERTWRVLLEVGEPRPVLASSSQGVLLDGPCVGKRPTASSFAVADERRVCLVSGAGAREHRVSSRRALVVATKAGVLSLEPPRAAATSVGPSSAETSSVGPSSVGPEPDVSKSEKAQRAESSQAEPRAGRSKTAAPPKLAFPGELRDERGESRTLVFPEDEELARFLSVGQWLPGATPRPGGGLTAWVVAGERFAGVRVDGKGRVEVGPIQKPARRAVLSGRFGFLWGAAGFAKETVDGGQSWHETALPYRTGDSDPTQPADPTQRIELGCSAAGCVIGPWIRVGWNATGNDAPAWEEASPPPVRSPPASASSRWRLQCRATGRSSRPFAEDAPAAIRAQRAGYPTALHLELESSAAWQSFWEWRAPPVTKDAQGFSLGAHLERARLYASGPREGSWAERGRLQVAFANPFSIDPVRTTPPGRPPWSDARRAALAFGDSGQSGISHVYAGIDPGHEGGLLLLRSASDVDLFVFEKDRAPLPLRGASDLGLNSIEDAVKVGEAWFTLQRVGTSLRVVRARGGQLEELISLPLGRGETPWTRIVRNVGKTALGLWVEGEAGRVVYPLDPESGALGSPIAVPKLGGAARACSDSVEGYVLTTEVSPLPHVTVSGTKQPVDLHRITAQLVVGGPELCVMDLSAGTRDEVQISGPSAPVDEEAVTMTVTEQRAGGRRWEMMCR